ncbi:MAG: hypothetical protein ACLQIQ_09425 [Beijerinckiaceae bacterium]
MQAKPVQEIEEGRVRQILKSAGVALMATGLFFGSAAAAPLPNQSSFGPVATPQSAIELAQLPIPIPVPVPGLSPFWGGHQYCWYDDGWQGGGWYWCGYAWRNGYGFGGPEGFRGWGRGRGGLRGGPHGGGHPHGAPSHGAPHSVPHKK